MRVVELGFQRQKKGVVVKPMTLILAELLIRGSQIGAGTRLEVLPTFFQQPMLKRSNRVVVDGGRGEWVVGAIFGAKKLVFNQPIGADEQCVTRE